MAGELFVKTDDKALAKEGREDSGAESPKPLSWLGRLKQLVLKSAATRSRTN